MIFLLQLMNWIDPEIANLQPVLNSYWLMIRGRNCCELWAALGMILGQLLCY
jgi:hypothetical protein